MNKIIREKFEKELEERTEKKVRNCFFLCSGTNGAEYYIFTGNNNSLLGVLELIDFGTDKEFHRWI